MQPEFRSRRTPPKGCGLEGPPIFQHAMIDHFENRRRNTWTLRRRRSKKTKISRCSKDSICVRWNLCKGLVDAYSLGRPIKEAQSPLHPPLTEWPTLFVSSCPLLLFFWHLRFWYSIKDETANLRLSPPSPPLFSWLTSLQCESISRISSDWSPPKQANNRAVCVFVIICISSNRILTGH